MGCPSLLQFVVVVFCNLLTFGNDGNGGNGNVTIVLTLFSLRKYSMIVLLLTKKKREKKITKPERNMKH